MEEFSDVISCLRARGLLDQITHEQMGQICAQPRKVYYGVDATAGSLHVGNLLGVVVLRWLQRYGHTPVVLVGGATTRIGDPSGKSVERPLLTEEEVDRNAANIAAQLRKMLGSSESAQQPLFCNNADWLGSYQLIDFLRDVGRYFRVGAMLAKESVRARMESEEGISFTEFSYQLLQGYDFYHLYTEMGVEIQIGGSDQWGNITAGTELIRRKTGGTGAAYGITFPLLTNSEGKKLGKTESGALWIDPDRCSPYELYQYFLSFSDPDALLLLKRFTFLDLATIAEWEKSWQAGTLPPHTLQKRLAGEVVGWIHGDAGLQDALKATEALAPGSDAALLDAARLEQIAASVPQHALSLSQVVGARYTEVAALAGLVSSKGEALRLVQNGGGYLNNQKVEDPQRRIDLTDLIGGKYLLLAAGKKHKKLVVVTP